MEAIFLFFLVFRFVGIAGGLYFAWKIARMPITPTRTWALFAAGWVMWLLQGVLYYYLVDRAIDNGHFTILSAMNAVAQAVVVLFFFAATVRTYYDLRRKFDKIL